MIIIEPNEIKALYYKNFKLMTPWIREKYQNGKKKSTYIVVEFDFIFDEAVLIRELKLNRS
ncbi:hypothetical protein B6259_01000 [Ruminococcaceae bacterium CPB6]|nr:hypothetical protein B6259_01000 [Ruminococcaceae bacterium CPB6]